MTVRPGMKRLIARIRQLTETGASDYSIGDQTYWSDEELQSWLDEQRQQMTGVALIARPLYVSGAHVYKRYEFPGLIRNPAEGPEGGQEIFRVYDSLGADVDQANYTFNDRDFSVTFTADTEGGAYYWDGFVYDIQAVAQGIWLAKAGHMHSAINFSSDGQRFDREAVYQHCKEMAEKFGNAGGAGVAKAKASRFYRTDLAGSPNAVEF